MSLRLGVNCAVFDEEGRVLLSRRGDLGVWNLPGGRLDEGELLEAAAVREVREETGIVVEIERAVGLYYLAGWQRMNVLYAGRAVGGELKAHTDESSENRFFAPDELPPDLWQPIMIQDALAETRPMPHIIETNADELRKIRLRLKWRWMKNLLAGRREPKFPTFQVEAVANILDDSHRLIAKLNGKLPSVICKGEHAPWQELAELAQEFCRTGVNFRWGGIEQKGNNKSFVFTVTIRNDELRPPAIWTALPSNIRETNEPH